MFSHQPVRAGEFPVSAIATGYAFADFLLGYAQQTEFGGGARGDEVPLAEPVLYFADTWKLRSNMTFDLGLRYEYIPPWLDKNDT